MLAVYASIKKQTQTLRTILHQLIINYVSDKFLKHILSIMIYELLFYKYQILDCNIVYAIIY